MCSYPISKNSPSCSSILIILVSCEKLFSLMAGSSLHPPKGRVRNKLMQIYKIYSGISRTQNIWSETCGCIYCIVPFFRLFIQAQGDWDPAYSGCPS